MIHSQQINYFSIRKILSTNLHSTISVRYGQYALFICNIDYSALILMIILSIDWLICEIVQLICLVYTLAEVDEYFISSEVLRGRKEKF